MKCERVVVDLGQLFSYLTVIGFAHRLSAGRKRRQAIVRCVCGVTKAVDIYRLPDGDVKSCGCRQEEWEDPAVIFARNVRIDEGGCHLWTGGRDKDGYGKFSITIASRNDRTQQQRSVRAHRFAFFLKHGRWPKRLVLHSCDNPPCVNTDHLSEGTQSQNIQQCVARGRHPSQMRKRAS